MSLLLQPLIPSPPPILGTFNVAIQLQGIDITTIASSPASYSSLVSGLEIRTAAAMKIPPSSISIISIVPGSIVVTFEVAMTNPSFTAEVMYATLVANSPAAFESSFFQNFGITGMSSKMVAPGSAMPFPPSSPQVPPSAAAKAMNSDAISPSTSSSAPTTLSPSPSGSLTSPTGTVVIIVATVASVAGAAAIAAVVVVVLKRRGSSSGDSGQPHVQPREPSRIQSIFESVTNAGGKSRIFPSAPPSASEPPLQPASI